MMRPRLLLTSYPKVTALNKLLSNEFLTYNSLIKKYYKNNGEFHEVITK